MSELRQEWIRKAALEVLIRNSPNVLNREKASRDLVDLVYLVADEMERRGAFGEVECPNGPEEAAESSEEED